MNKFIYTDEDAIEFDEIIEKHAMHDQSTHGSWANQNFDEDGIGQTILDEYTKKYDKDSNGNMFGISKEEYLSLDDYVFSGYLRINKQLRDNIIGDKSNIKNIDAVIDNAPVSFGNTILYRVMDNKLLSNLEPEDIITDKGFISTTRVNITDKINNQETIQWFQNLKEETATASVILPNKTKNGKGVAVDYLKIAVRDSSTISDTEKEVLLPRNTSLKFLGYENLVPIFERVN